MTENPSSAPADVDAVADRIDAYIHSVEQVLIAAAVPAAERVQILGDLETQITEMLNNEQFPFTDSTIEAVISKLEPPSHFAAAYAAEPQSPGSTLPRIETIRNSPWVLAAAGSCATFLFSSFLLILCGAQRVAPPVAMFVLLLTLSSAIAVPIVLRKGVAQLRAEPNLYFGRGLAAGTAVVYWTVMPLLVLLSACALTDGYILYPIAIGAFAYVQYILIGGLYRRITGEVFEPSVPGSLGASLRGFTRKAQPAVGM